MTILRVDDLVKEFPRVEALRSVSLEVKAGEIYALIGPNGAGKTTLVKSITGLVTPDSGQILVEGFDTQEEPVLTKKRLGYVPDEPFVYPYLTGRQFLELTADLHRLSRKSFEAAVKPLIKSYKLEGIIDGLATDYSRGNKQKLAMIAALMHGPKLLVIDEPIVGLDAQSQEVTLDIFKEFAKEGGGVLLCTHTLSVAETLADRIGILDQGKLKYEGDLASLKKKAGKKNGHLAEIFLKLVETGAK